MKGAETSAAFGRGVRKNRIAIVGLPCRFFGSRGASARAGATSSTAKQTESAMKDRSEFATKTMASDGRSDVLYS